MHVVPAAVASWIFRNDSFEFLYILAAAALPALVCVMLYRTAVREIVHVANILVAAFYGFFGTAIGLTSTFVSTMSESGRLADTPGWWLLVPVFAYAFTAIAVMYLCFRAMRNDRIRPPTATTTPQ
jgi:amino acid permease